MTRPVDMGESADQDLRWRAETARHAILDAVHVAAETHVVCLDRVPWHDREACDLALDSMAESEPRRVAALAAIEAALRLRWMTRPQPKLEPLVLACEQHAIYAGDTLRVGLSPDGGLCVAVVVADGATHDFPDIVLRKRESVTRLRDWLTRWLEASS